jgi:hypothetical protein
LGNPVDAVHKKDACTLRFCQLSQRPQSQASTWMLDSVRFSRALAFDTQGVAWVARFGNALHESIARSLKPTRPEIGNYPIQLGIWN